MFCEAGGTRYLFAIDMFESNSHPYPLGVRKSEGASERDREVNTGRGKMLKRQKTDILLPAVKMCIQMSSSKVISDLVLNLGGI